MNLLKRIAAWRQEAGEEFRRQRECPHTGFDPIGEHPCPGCGTEPLREMF